jgi:hypothetical protein
MDLLNYIIQNRTKQENYGNGNTFIHGKNTAVESKEIN